MKHITSFLFVILIFFSSCKKDSDEELPTYLGTTLSTRITKLYDKNGEITDRAIVDRFSNTYGDFDPNMELSLMTFKFKADYLDASTVVVKSLITLEKDTMTVIKNDGLIIWESKDTSDYYTSHFDAFKYKWLHYSEVSINGTMLITKFLYCMFLKPCGDDLLLPITYFYHRRGNYLSFSTLSSNGNNEFNPDYIAGFGNMDTVLVYEYTLRMRAQ